MGQVTTTDEKVSTEVEADVVFTAEVGGVGTAAEIARAEVETILSKGRLAGEVEVVEIDGRIELEINGPDAGLLVGRHGATLDALQYLVNRIVSRRVTEHRGVWIDSDGYRQRREASLVEMAQRLSEKALEEQRVVSLDPMNPRERRVVHMALRDVDGVCTRSEGEGEARHLLIVPEGCE